MSDEVKESIAKKAVKLVQNNMIVGLGTGTTADVFTYFLSKRIQQEKLNIKVVASSKKTEELARERKMDLLDPAKVEHIDLYFDGADEIDSEKNMIKGKGGALLREKMLAFCSEEVVILVEEKKLVSHLGSKGILPVEIVPFALAAIKNQLKERGYVGHYRLNEDKTFFQTDNHNVIFDICIEKNERLTYQDHENIKQIPTVVETGLFFDITGRVIVGYEGQKVEILN